MQSITLKYSMPVALALAFLWQKKVFILFSFIIIICAIKLYKKVLIV